MKKEPQAAGKVDEEPVIRLADMTLETAQEVKADLGFVRGVLGLIDQALMLDSDLPESTYEVTQAALETMKRLDANLQGVQTIIDGIHV